MNKLLKCFELHGPKLAAVLMLTVFAQNGVFGPAVASAAGVIGLLVLLAMAVMLVQQYRRSAPIVKDAALRVLDAQQKR